MGLSMEQRVVTPTAKKWADARSVRRAMVHKATSYLGVDAQAADSDVRNLAARLWRAVRHAPSPAYAVDVKIAGWAEAELGTPINSLPQLARLRFACQQLKLGNKLFQPLEATEKQAVLALMPQPLPPETPVAMPEQELAGIFSGALRFLRFPLSAFRT